MPDATFDNCLSDELIDRYHAGELDDTERAGAEIHLVRCDACRKREGQRRAAAERILRSLQDIDRPVTGEPTAAVVPSIQRVERGRPVAGAPGSDCATKDPVFPRIEGYELIRILGRGGMGIVYEAVQNKLGRHVALKVLPAVVSSAHRDLVERFRREATAASKLHHTNIIPIYDYGESRDGYFYAMERLDGQPLSIIIKRIAAQAAPITSPTDIAAVVGLVEPGGTGFQPVDDRRDACPTPGSSTDRGRVYYRQVASWMAEAADALHYAHLQGLIHRDVKPGNIMVCRDGRIVLVDFGLVKEVSSDSVTATGSLLGTYRYMSPEQIGAKRIRVDARTDVYSLGATLYELLTLQPAYTAADQSELLGQILWKEPTPPRKVVPSVPVDLQTICLKAMEKSPAARYATARDMADDLRQFIGNLPIKARPVGALGRLGKLAGRHPGVSIMAGVVLAMVGTFAAVAVYQHGRQRGETVNKLNAEAQQLWESGDWTAAEARFTEALRLDPENLSALVNYGRLEKDFYYRNGQQAHLQKMLSLADAALEIDPAHANSLNLRMVALREQGEFQDALQVCESIREADSTYFAAPVNAGGIHALRGDMVTAERELREGARLAAADRRADSIPMPWRNLAALEHFIGSADAWQTLEASFARTRGASDGGVLSFTALLRLQIPEHEELHRALNEAISADNGCTNARGERINRNEAVPRVLALAYLRNGQLENAADAAKSALRQHDPIECHARLILAAAEAGRGNLDEARRQRELAEAAWKREINSGGYVCRIENGFLWFVSKEEMDRLRRELDALLSDAGSPGTN